MPTIRIQDLIIPKFDETLFDILDHRHTHYTFPGGRGGTKSSFIGIVIPLLITQNKGVHAAVFRKVSNTMRDSVYAQIIAGIGMLQMEHLFKCTVSPMEITYIPTGQKIMFRGLDKPEKIKSIKVPFGYIGITWFEELDQYNGRAEIRTVQQSTMRGGEKFWNFESFNPPITSANWANKDLLIDRPDRLITWSNYLDVPRYWLGEQFLSEAEHLKEINERAYRHEYLGEATGTGGMVFENVVIRTITEAEIMSFDRIFNGVDWGWFPDAWAFGRSNFHAGTRRLWIFGEARRHKTKPQETGLIVKSMIMPGELVTCDNIPPENTADYQDMGINAVRAIKGPGSRERRYQWLQGLTEIIIDPKRCPKTYEEFVTKEYDRTKDGEFISAYPDGDDHSIDANCYATEDLWRNKEGARRGLLA